MSMQPRRALPQDLEGIINLESVAFAADERFNRRQIQRLITNPKADVLVMTVGAGKHAEIIGWAAALTRRRHLLLIGRIYAVAVHPDRRGGRLGWRLTNALMQALTARNCRRIYLEVRSDNLPAIALYEGFGFTRYEELSQYYGEGRNGLRFKLDLPSASQSQLVASPA